MNFTFLYLMAQNSYFTNTQIKIKHFQALLSIKFKNNRIITIFKKTLNYFVNFYELYQKILFCQNFFN